MNIRKDFTTNPNAHLRATREVVDRVNYSCAVERYKAPSGYSTAWWCAFTVMCAVALLVVTLYA